MPQYFHHTNQINAPAQASERNSTRHIRRTNKKLYNLKKSDNNNNNNETKSNFIKREAYADRNDKSSFQGKHSRNF